MQYSILKEFSIKPTYFISHTNDLFVINKPIQAIISSLKQLISYFYSFTSELIVSSSRAVSLLYFKPNINLNWLTDDIVIAIFIFTLFTWFILQIYIIFQKNNFDVLSKMEDLEQHIRILKKQIKTRDSEIQNFMNNYYIINNRQEDFQKRFNQQQREMKKIKKDISMYI